MQRVKYLKLTTTLFALSALWCYNQSGVTEQLIMRGPCYGRMCFKSVKTLEALHSYLWNRLRPSASAFSTAKNVELLGL